MFVPFVYILVATNLVLLRLALAHIKNKTKTRKSLKLPIARGHATHPSEHHNVKSHQLFLSEKIQLDLM